jgi:hypothetical protein
MPEKNGAMQFLQEEAAIQEATAVYIAATFGSAFSIHSADLIGEKWWIRIRCQHPELDEPLVVGSFWVDALTGQITPLTLAEIKDIQERASILIAHRQQGEARDANGFILPSQAKVKATGYVAEHIAFFARAEGQPQWLEGVPPLWRVAIAMWLRGQGNVCDLGFVDVNAISGDILPLSEDELATRQKRARHAAEAVARSAAATS